MHRYDILPSNENVKKSLETNALGLNAKIFNAARFLDSLDCATSICLDGKWGSGKTFFVKELKLLLDSDNDLTKNPIETISKLPNKPELKQTYATVYFDAWENDLHQDPLLSLIYVIAKQFSQEYKFEQVKIDEAVKNVLSGLLKNVLKVDVQNILDGSYIDNFLTKIKEENNIQQKIKDFFFELAAEHGDRVLIIIDELDRCRPDYAIQLLERIKHYICCDQVTFLFAMNTTELENIVKQYYGQDFNATGYLDKFFDFRMSLPEINTEQYLDFLGITNKSEYIYFVRTSVINFLNFDKREINRFLMYCDIALDKTKTWNATYTGEGCAALLISRVIVPCIIGLRIKDSKQFNLFINGKNCELLKNVFTNKNLYFFISKLMKTKDISEIKVTEIHKKVEEAYDALFNFDFTGDQFAKEVGDYLFNKRLRDLTKGLISMLSEYSEFAK